MKIDTEAHELNDAEKLHAYNLIKQMLISIDNIEESYILFCSDEENKEAAKKLANMFKEDKNFEGEVDEAVLFMSIFKAKLMSEYNRLNSSINKYN